MVGFTWTPYTEGKERPERNAGSSRSVAGRFNEQGSLFIYMGCLGWLQYKHITTSSFQNLKSLYRGINWVQSYIPSR